MFGDGKARKNEVGLFQDARGARSQSMQDVPPTANSGVLSRIAGRVTDLTGGRCWLGLIQPLVPRPHSPMSPWLATGRC